MTQSILYGSSGVSWQSLDHGFNVLMDAWKRHQRRFPSPGAVLAAAMKVLCHRLFLRYADRVGRKQEHYRQFFNPFWLEPTAFTAAETVHQPVPQVSLVYRLEFLKHLRTLSICVSFHLVLSCHVAGKDLRIQMLGQWHSFLQWQQNR